jgi:hypothetical protein
MVPIVVTGRQARAVVINTETMTSNNNDSAGVTANKKSLGNCGTGFSGGVVQPSGFPVGQLWCTAAAKAAGEGAGGPVQGVVNATITGTGTSVMDNGHSSGGTDSPATLTATYGGSTDDAICSGDPNNTLATPYTGLSPAACVANSSAVFAQSTASSFGNSDVLFTAVYTSNSTALDTATNAYFDQYWCVDDLSTLHDFEFEPNINSSPTAYGAGTGAFFGWGMHWNATANMFQYCPQNCSAWITLKGKDITGATADLTTYSLTNGHCYRTRNYNHRLPGCNFSSGSACAFYDYLTVYDVTAGTTPITYKLLDAVSGLQPAFIPVDNHTFSSGVYDHIQLDMTAADTLTQVRVISHTLTYFAFQ